ncbi:MAG TPA: hypothetical protein VIN03_25355 [Roseateles sp.]
MALTFHQLLSEADTHEYGAPEKAELLDRAIALADETAHTWRQFQARKARMEAAIFGGEAELALSLFAWCRRMSDDRPDVIDPTALLWTYKHIVMQLPRFSRISQAQMDAVAQEMEASYQACGASPRPVLAKRAEAAVGQGRITQARELSDAAMQHPRDRWADCAACETAFSIEVLLGERRFSDLIDAAKPIVAGQVRCAEVPHMVLTNVMLAHAALGEADQVETLRRQSYRLVQRNPAFIKEVSLHIELHVSQDQLPEAARLATRHMPWLGRATDDRSQFHFLRALHILLAALVRAPVRASAWRTKLLETLEARYDALPEGSTLEARQQALAAVVADKGLKLATAFDKRNGNDAFLRAWEAPAFKLGA